MPAPVIEQTVIEAGVPGGGGRSRSAAGEAVNRHAVLTAGVQDITQTLSGEYNLNDVLRIILRRIPRAWASSTLLLLRATRAMPS